MKRKAFLFALCMCLCIAFLASCLGEPPQGTGKNEGEGEKEVVKIAAAQVAETTYYRPTPETRQTLLSSATGTDGRYNYFYVKLGTVARTPVYYDTAYHHTGIADMPYEWIDVDVYERTVTDTIEESVSQTVSRELSLGVSSQLEHSLGFEFSGLSLEAKQTASTNLELSLGHESTDTVTKSTATSVTHRMEKIKKRSYVIAQDCPVGTYRFTVYATAHLYAVLICDPETKSYTYTYYSIIDDRSLTEELSYTAGDTFQSDAVELLALDTSVLEGIDLYARNYPLLNAETTYENNTRKTVYDDGKYGFEQQSTQEKLDLSPLKNYLTSDYHIVFSLVVGIEEKNDGYQEVLLYNRDPGYSSNSEDFVYVNAVSAGLVGYSYDIDSGKGAYEKELTFTVSGDKCREKMFLRYDANGEEEDTWYRNFVRITIRAEKK